MAKYGRSFFNDKEILFVGYSIKNNKFSRDIYNAFTNGGIKVYPLNSNADGSHDIKVYKNISELPKVPTTAYVLLNKENAVKAVKTLLGSGVKRILFQNKSYITEEALEDCKKNGIETNFGCPMMVFGSGFHKFHAFFAGVR